MRRASEDVVTLGATPADAPWGPTFAAEGVIEVLEPLVSETRRARIESVLSRRLESVTVLMDAPHDPHNGAAVMRSCDAFGVQDLHVVPRSEPFVVSSRVAKGTEHWVDVRVHESGDQAVSALRGRGFVLVATHPSGQILPEELGAIERLALVLGNEHDGICHALTEAADRSVRIPMRGFVESLNVSVSAAVLLEHATRGRHGDLDDARRRSLYARGLFITVPRALEVLEASKLRARTVV